MSFVHTGVPLTAEGSPGLILVPDGIEPPLLLACAENCAANALHAAWPPPLIASSTDAARKEILYTQSTLVVDPEVGADVEAAGVPVDDDGPPHAARTAASAPPAATAWQARTADLRW